MRALYYACHMRLLVKGLVWVLGTASFVASGCGGSSEGGGGGGSSGNVPLDNVPNLLAQAECSALERCLGALAELAVGSDCVTTAQAGLEDKDWPAIKDAISAGTVKYDGTKATACFDAIKTASCDVLNNGGLPDICQQAVRGTVADGSSCTLNAECSSVDSFCKIGSTCPGTCAPKLGAGSPCKAKEDCQKGLTCFQAAGAAMPTCTMIPGVGDACGGNRYPDCSGGLFCAGDNKQTSTAGSCKTIDEAFKAPVGSACDLNTGQLCAIGGSCAITGVSGTTLQSECKAVTTAGGACNLALPDMCPTGQGCDLTRADLQAGTFVGSCVVLPKPGEPCSEAFGKACEQGSTCIPNTSGTGSTCRQVERLDGACLANEACYSSTCRNGTCVAPGPCAP